MRCVYQDGLTFFDACYAWEVNPRIEKTIARTWHSSPLLKAVYEKNLSAFRALIASKRCDINKYIAGGWTCLQAACFLNRFEFVEELLCIKKTDIFAVSRESRLQTALHIACNRGHTEIVRLLLRQYTDRTSTAGRTDTARRRVR